MNVGDILNYDYTGDVQTVTLTAGKFLLEVWGAQGGNGYNSTTYAGGKGGNGYAGSDGAVIIYYDRQVRTWAN